MFKLLLWILLGLVIHSVIPDLTLLGISLVLFIGYTLFSLNSLALLGLALYGLFTLLS